GCGSMSSSARWHSPESMSGQGRKQPANPNRTQTQPKRVAMKTILAAGNGANLTGVIGGRAGAARRFPHSREMASRMRTYALNGFRSMTLHLFLKRKA